MKYPYKTFRADFPDDQACLEWLVNYLYPDGITCVRCNAVTHHNPVKGRRSYACTKCGKHMNPTAGTIFHGSRTPLTDWFHAIYMLSSHKSGYSAKQLQREIGTTYKTCFRMLHLIREMMVAPDEAFEGEVEADETFIHANTFKRSSARRRYGYNGMRTGEILFGIVQRNGAVRIWHVQTAGARILKPIIQKHLKPGSLIHTDGWKAYSTLYKLGYKHRWTNHSIHQYFTPDSSTQNIENVWSHLKRGIKGIYRHVEKVHLQKYANEYAWRYSHRKEPVLFWSLIADVSKSKS